MITEEVKLTLHSSGMSYRARVGYLCRSALRRKIILPANVKTIYAVFTKTERPESFAIVSDAGYFGNVASLSGVRGGLTHPTRSTLWKYQKKGFGFVRVEYDEVVD